MPNLNIVILFLGNEPNKDSVPDNISSLEKYVSNSENSFFIKDNISGKCFVINCK